MEDTHSNSNKLQMPDQQQDDHSHSPILECPICLSDSSNIQDHIILDCNHVFCQGCLKEYLTTQICSLKVLKIPCPQDKCQSAINEKLLQQILDPEVFEKYQQFVIQKINTQKGNKICPKAGCSKFITPAKESLYSTCTCGSLVCNSCNNFWHEGKTCYEAMDREFEIYARENELKMCLMCKTMVARVEGCTHITCPICDYEWCWICGHEYKAGHQMKCTKEWNPLPPKKITKRQAFKSKTCLEKTCHILHQIFIFIVLFIPRTLFWPFYILNMRTEVLIPTRSSEDKAIIILFLVFFNALYLGAGFFILYMITFGGNQNIFFFILGGIVIAFPWIFRLVLKIANHQKVRWHSRNMNVFNYTGNFRPAADSVKQPEKPQDAHVEIISPPPTNFERSGSAMNLLSFSGFQFSSPKNQEIQQVEPIDESEATHNSHIIELHEIFSPEVSFEA